MKWIRVKDRLPDNRKLYVVVFAPKGLYFEDCELPKFHILFWFKNGFSEEHERHQEIMEKITHWMPLPEIAED